MALARPVIQHAAVARAAEQEQRGGRGPGTTEVWFEFGDGYGSGDEGGGVGRKKYYRT